MHNLVCHLDPYNLDRMEHVVLIDFEKRDVSCEESLDIPEFR